VNKMPSLEDAKSFKDKFLIQTVPIQEVPNDFSEMWKEIESEHQPKNKMYAYHGQQLKCKLVQPVDEQALSANSIDKPTSTNSIEKPPSTNSIENPRSTNSIDKPTSTNSIDKPQPTSTNSIDKPPSAPSEDNVKDIKKECSSDPKVEHQMLINEIEYHELIAEKEKYKKVLEEVSLLATNSQQLSNEIQLWKDRFFQEQSKREAYELEIQELKNQAKAINEKSPLESPVLTNNNNDPNPISKNGLSHRSNAESSEKLKKIIQTLNLQ